MQSAQKSHRSLWHEADRSQEKHQFHAKFPEKSGLQATDVRVTRKETRVGRLLSCLRRTGAPEPVTVITLGARTAAPGNAGPAPTLLGAEPAAGSAGHRVRETQVWISAGRQLSSGPKLAVDVNDPPCEPEAWPEPRAGGKGVLTATCICTQHTGGPWACNHSSAKPCVSVSSMAPRRGRRQGAVNVLEKAAFKNTARVRVGIRRGNGDSHRAGSYRPPRRPQGEPSSHPGAALRSQHQVPRAPEGSSSGYNVSAAVCE